jgi:hypothetical protein
LIVNNPDGAVTRLGSVVVVPFGFSLVTVMRLPVVMLPVLNEMAPLIEKLFTGRTVEGPLRVRADVYSE